jgi:hypothetical protein
MTIGRPRNAAGRKANELTKRNSNVVERSGVEPPTVTTAVEPKASDAINPIIDGEPKAHPKPASTQNTRTPAAEKLMPTTKKRPDPHEEAYTKLECKWHDLTHHGFDPKTTSFSVAR